jgi:hypothetical protein
MELSEILYQKTNDVLKQYARLCNGCSGATRKDDLVGCIRRTLLTPESLHAVWGQLDTLSKKAVAMAYHNQGKFFIDGKWKNKMRRVKISDFVPRVDNYYLKIFITAQQYFAGSKYLSI